MLHLRSSNGYQNVFSLDVYSSVYANTISNFGVENSLTRQYTPNFNSDYTGFNYYIKLIDQLSQKDYWSLLYYNVTESKYPRALQFKIYLDDYVGDYHINIETTGLFDYEVYLGQLGATSSDDSLINGLVANGIALVHNDNFVNDYFQNSESGVTKSIISNSISYNG
tara:strand:- start:2284 stop:2784 length:501 start_codon:yes stop_codon:yes gene_type:complete